MGWLVIELYYYREVFGRGGFVVVGSLCKPWGAEGRMHIPIRPLDEQTKGMHAVQDYYSFFFVLLFCGILSMTGCGHCVEKKKRRRERKSMPDQSMDSGTVANAGLIGRWLREVQSLAPRSNPKGLGLSQLGRSYHAGIQISGVFCMIFSADIS